MDQKVIDEIYEKCYYKTKIGYDDDGGFFNPKLTSINHLEVGRSKIISSPAAIILEWLYTKFDHARDAVVAWWQKTFPRNDIFYGTRLDSSLIGRIIHDKKGPVEIPIHNLRVEFWARTTFFQWKKLSAGHTDNDGYFDLPFDLRAAQSGQNRKQLRFEIYQMSRVYHEGDDPTPVDEIFQVIKIPKSDLIGLSYNLRTIRLCYWEYRDDTSLPRVLIKDHDKDAPQYYSHKRTEAMAYQFIPIELTKRKHLKQIEKDSSKISLAEIQDDYPDNLTVAMEKMLPGITRSDEWFAQRVMNGMNMATFLPDKNNPSEYWVKYFGEEGDNVNDEYAFPTSEIKFKLKEDGYPLPLEIHFTGPLNAFNKDPWQKNIFTRDDGDKWEAAKRIVRVNGGLCTEVDEHLTATHLNVEQYAIAAYRNLRFNPVAWLVYPHLKEVVLVNHTADKILIHDYLPSATALTFDGINRRSYHILGLLDWKGWAPMKPLSSAHTYAMAEDLFWELTGKYVDHFFEEHLEDIKKYWYEVYLFSKDLVEHAVPLYHSNMHKETLSPEEKEMEEKRIEYYKEQYRLDFNLSRVTVNGELKSVSPITSSPEFDPQKTGDIQNLKDACQYMIMMATFMHTWANEHQYEDIGEVLYCCLGLRYGDKESGVMAPESDLGIAPDLTRSTQMMWFSNLLSRTEYGFITRNEEKDIDPHFSQMLEDKKEVFAKWKVDVTNIESRTNI